MPWRVRLGVRQRRAERPLAFRRYLSRRPGQALDMLRHPRRDRRELLPSPWAVDDHGHKPELIALPLPEAMPIRWREGVVISRIPSIYHPDRWKRGWRWLRFTNSGT